MRNYLESEERVFADRLVNYSDALIALAFITTSGLGLAIADPETRQTFEEVAGSLVVVNVMLGLTYSCLLMILRRWENKLRSDAPLPPMVVRYSRNLYIARHVVVWLAVWITVFIMLAIR